MLLWFVFLGASACSNYSGTKSRQNKIDVDNSINTVQKSNAHMANNTLKKNNDLAKIYSQAIAEFIKSAYKKDQTTFDTLFFGKHVYGQDDDFPDIELPLTIEKTQIRLISPEEGQKKQSERKSMIYINMIGWVEDNNAEFIFVVFSNGGEHQNDYFINFTTNASTTKFYLDKIEFENHLHLNGKKPIRIVLYKDGKYSGKH